MLVEFPQHAVRPFIGHGKLFDNLSGLLKYLFLTKVVLACAGTFLLCAMVIVMPFLPLASDGAITLRTLEPANEMKILVSPVLHFTSILHNQLARVEQLFADEWLERTFMQFTVHLHESAVNGIFQHRLDGGLAHDVVQSTAEILPYEKVLDRIERVLSGGVQPERFSNDRRFL
ncbi:hypothetical protein A3H22_01550 [Candidatus Peribacteria bacterium RIFCSPLOWO2_12_FULL_55_15]|nr:MAG: hypothetical protein A2789_02170 [Candidatus Peribacteria bacterium RIFCSPHIGHO2_01_FULL_54_22]OGJ70267.1 MAG: hypothetical protein A3H90_03385 [Candidatus Peribacteria bacterium RIFCSPLOWO2_02_FULL_55_36]OGJ72254.1 MAG: hypothetical protein A3H22_01550 [Candidatus Peribacteria bacterium RIFCSPLOWO2_12_FULL_55_15]